MAVGDRDAGRCAFFAPEPISRSLLSGARNVSGPAELLDALSDSIRLGRVIRAINQYALAKINHRDNTIMLHRLVQRVFVNQMGPQEAAELRHCGHQPLANSDPQGPELAARWPRYLDLLPHVLYSDIVDCDDSWVRDLILNVLEFLFRWGDNRGLPAARGKGRRILDRQAGAGERLRGERRADAGLPVGDRRR